MSTTDKAAPAPVATPEEVRSFRQQQADEWGQYVAVDQISVNGALAFNAGDSVPASWVKAHKSEEQGLVAKVNSKAGTDLIRSLHAAATTGSVVDVGNPVSLSVSVPDSK